MKFYGFCVVFLMVVTTFTYFSFSSTTVGPSWFPAYFFDGTKCADETTTPIAASRKLKENENNIKSNEKGDGIVSVEDYNPIDPTPGGSKNVNAGPIEHGTPLMPFIPKSPPPNPGPGDYD